MNQTLAIATAPGDVYLVAGTRWIVVATDGMRVVVAPLVYRNVPPCRNDLNVEDVSDLLAIGLPSGRYTVRLTRMAMVGGRRQVRVGCASAALVAQLRTAAAREGEARRIEASVTRKAA